MSFWGYNNHMNTQIFYFFYNLSHKSTMLDGVAVFITDTFDKIVLGLAICYMVYLFTTHPYWKLKNKLEKLWEAFIVTASTIGAYAAAYILKILVHAPRPFVTHRNVYPLVSETSYSSFPSGHATLFFALAMVIYFYDKRIGLVFFFFAVLIAISRMVVGVHYPIDVIAGALLGVVTSWVLHRYILKSVSTIFLSKKQ
jgi:undecaprenyl-diphosphatase